MAGDKYTKVIRKGPIENDNRSFYTYVHILIYRSAMTIKTFENDISTGPCNNVLQLILLKNQSGIKILNLLI